MYGDSNPAFTGTLTGVKYNDPITATYETAATAATGVGSYDINPVIHATATVLTNYQTPVLTKGTLTITKAPLSAKADDKTKVYGDTNPTLTGTLTGVKNNDPITASSSTTATAATGVGVNAITPSINATSLVLANYQTPVLTNGALTITKAPLSAKADDKTKVLNAPNPTFTGSLTGVKNSDSIALTFTTTATAATGVGTYPITPVINATAAVLANYQTSVLTNGTLTVQYASAGTCNGDIGHQILQPVNTDGSSVFKQGSTVPAKFRVCDANGVSIGATGTVTSFKLVQTINGTLVNTVDEAVDSTTPDTAFRWSSSDQQWIYNINTKSLKANYTYYYDITLNDGTHVLFHFGLK